MRVEKHVSYPQIINYNFKYLHVSEQPKYIEMGDLYTNQLIYLAVSTPQIVVSFPQVWVTKQLKPLPRL